MMEVAGQATIPSGAANMSKGVMGLWGYVGALVGCRYLPAIFDGQIDYPSETRRASSQFCEW
jgi:hypothetical protein